MKQLVQLRQNLFLFMIVSLAATACFQGEQSVQENADQTKTLLLQAVFADEPGTKTQYDDGSATSGTLYMHWCVGDQINLFFDNTRATNPFTATIEEPAARTGFTGQIDFATGVDGAGATAENFYFYAYYPYGGTDVTINNGVVTATLPAEQPSVHGNNIASGLLPWAAKSENLMLTFYQPASVFRFKLTTENVQYVELSGKNHEKIAGTYSFNFSGTPVRPEVTDRSSGVETIRLNAPENGVFNTGTWYYVVLLPTDFTQGWTLKAYTSNSVGTCTFGHMTFNKAQYTSYTEESHMTWEARPSYVTIASIYSDNSIRVSMFDEHTPPFTATAYFNNQLVSEATIKWYSRQPELATIGENTGLVTLVGARQAGNTPETYVYVDFYATATYNGITVTSDDLHVCFFENDNASSAPIK